MSPCGVTTEERPDPERLLTQREVAEIFRVCLHTVKCWRQRGTIGYIELSRFVFRIPQSEVDRLLAEGRHPAIRSKQLAKPKGEER